MSALHNGKILLFNCCEMESQMSDLSSRIPGRILTIMIKVHVVDTMVCRGEGRGRGGPCGGPDCVQGEGEREGGVHVVDLMVCRGKGRGRGGPCGRPDGVQGEGA